MNSLLTEETFLPTATRQLLDHVCRIARLDATGAVLLRHQTNAVYHLPHEQIIVKITRPDTPLQKVQHTVELVQWFTTNGLPTVGLTDRITQPVPVANCVTTFWRYLPQPAHRPITAAHLGPLLRHLHGLPPAPISIDTLDAVSAIRRSIGASRMLDSDDHAFLTKRCDDLATELKRLSYDLPPGIIHGDPQHRNTLWDGDTPVLSDWESARQGPREWDLVTIDVHCRRFGHPLAEYAAFVSSYGYDIREWAGYRTLRDLRELRMITTNARKSPPGSAAAQEVQTRIDHLRQNRADMRWNIL